MAVRRAQGAAGGLQAGVGRLLARLGAVLLAGVLTACQPLTELPPPAAMIGRAALLAADEPRREIALPDDWARSAPEREGVVRYRLDLPQDALQAGPASLYIPRVGPRVRVRLNGERLAEFGHPRRAPLALADASAQPVLVALPSGLLRPRGNQVEIEVQGEPGRESGLSVVWVGPSERLEPAHAALVQWQGRGAWAVGAAAAVMGVLALMLASRVRHFGYACFGVASLLWAWRVTALEPGGDLPWTPVVALLFQVSYAWFVVLMSLYALAVVGRDGPRARWALAAWALAALGLSALAWSENAPLLRTLVQLGSQLVLVALGAALIHRALRDRSLPAVLLALAALASLVVGARDLWVFHVAHEFGAVAWGRYSILALQAGLAWILVDEFARSAEGLRTLNRELADRVAQKERELAGAFEAARARDREQATLDERDRILREMHDGLGGRLVAAMALTQQAQRAEQEPGPALPADPEPAPARDDILRELRAALDDCLVELRLALDSLETDRRPLVEALAELRFRVQPSLQAAGVRLVWQPDDAVFDWSLPAADTLQVLRVVREALTNVIKHARAQTVWLRLEPVWGLTPAGEDAWLAQAPEPDGPPAALPRSLVATRLRIVDDGGQERPEAGQATALETPEGAASKGRGLANMARRAAALGAELRSGPQDGGWAVELTVPSRPLAPA